MTKQIDTTRWLSTFAHEHDEELVKQAAMEMQYAGIEEGSMYTRGTLSKAADSRLLEAERNVIQDALGRYEGETRRRLILALSRWGGQDAAELIASLLKKPDLDDETRMTCVHALATIGGAFVYRQLQRIQKRYSGALENIARFRAEDLKKGVKTH